MRRHRLFLGLTLAILLGFMGDRAQAATVTISVDLGGTTIYSTSGDVNITQLNTALKNATVDGLTNGSAYQFSANGLSSSLNNVAVSNGLYTETLTTTASIFVRAIGSTVPTLSVDVVASNIVAPSGPGTFSTTASGSFGGVAMGSTTYIGTYQSTMASPITGTYSAAAPSFSGSTPAQSVGTVPSGFSLANYFTVSLSKTTGGTAGFSGIATLTAVPEPSSVVMFLTGMPLPLAIVFGLIRRRRAQAA